MNTKLTLKLNKRVIERAKRYSSKRKTSISQIVESHLNALTTDETEDLEITELVRSISGVISSDKIRNYKSDYKKYITKKYK
jgi:hypothetical protein